MTIENDRRVVIDADGAPFKQRSDDSSTGVFGNARQPFSGRSGDRLGQFEEPVLLALAEVLRSKQLLRTEDAGAFLQRLFRKGKLVDEVLLRILTARHLAKPDFDDG